MALSSLRWGRIVLGGFLAELILIVIVIPMRLAGSAPPVPTIHYFAHLLKLAGGASGGWLAQRRGVA